MCVHIVSFLLYGGWCREQGEVNVCEKWLLPLRPPRNQPLGVLDLVQHLFSSGWETDVVQHPLH